MLTPHDLTSLSLKRRKLLYTKSKWKVTDPLHDLADSSNASNFSHSDTLPTSKGLVAMSNKEKLF